MTLQLTGIKRKVVVNLADIKALKKTAEKFLVAMARKLLLKRTLASLLLQSASVAYPQNMFEMSKEKANDFFKILLTNIIRLNILSPNQVLGEFKNCLRLSK